MIRVFLNVKGGVTKTTSAINIDKAAVSGKRVLLVDLDGQSNASSILLGSEYWGNLDWYNLLDDVVNKSGKDGVIEKERVTITDCLLDPNKAKRAIVKLNSVLILFQVSLVYLKLKQ